MPNDLGDLAQPTAPSSSMWVPWESPVPPVISRVLRAAGSGLRLRADAEVSSRSVAQALLGKCRDRLHCPGLCKQL